MDGQTAASNATPTLEKGSPAEPRSPSRLFWLILSVLLICGLICLTTAAALRFAQMQPKATQLNFHNHSRSRMNQSAFVNRSKNTVTYYVTSANNKTSSVLFDGKNGLVCYKPSEQKSCYVRPMDTRDRDTVQMSFNFSERKVDQLPLPNERTQYYREFLGIVAGRQVPPEETGEAIRSLCEQVPIYWVKKKDGPLKQRLIYLCLDICFPSNICVSICFYYLPE